MGERYYTSAIMQDCEEIKIIKPAPDDKLVTKILVSWFNLSQPKWRKVLEKAVLVFFVAVTIYSFFVPQLPLFTWLALTGAFVSLALSWLYVPFLVRSALSANKKVPLYYKEKNYDFFADHLVFYGEGIDAINVPYSSFSVIYKTDVALLFVFQKKLVFWLALEQFSPEQLESLERRFVAQQVKFEQVGK